MKLFWKIYLAVLMVTTAVVFFVAYTVSVSQISDARDQIVDRNKTVGRFLLKEIELGLIEGNWPFETLTELTQGKDFLFWWVVRPDGTIHLADKVPFMETNTRDYFPDVLKTTTSGQVVLQYGQGSGICVQPLESRAGRWSFWLGFSLRDVSRMKREIIMRSVSISLVGLLVVGIVLYLITERFVKPIGELSASAAVLGGGDLSHRVRIWTRDELGDLAYSFNRMAENLQQQETERARAERLLRESEEKYRSVFDNAAVGINLKSPEGTFREVNQTLISMLGYSRDELNRLSYLAITHPDDVQLSGDMHAALQRGDINTYRIEKRYLGKDGRVIWVDTAVRALRDSLGKVRATVGIIADITEKKNAEQALAESEERYRLLVENLNDVVYSVDMEGRISYISPAIERFTRYKTAELVGEPFQKFIHPDDLPWLIERYQKFLEGERVPDEYRVVDKDGREIHVRTYSRPVYKDGAIVGLTGLMMDITERKRAEELAFQHARLKAIADLSSGVAHHFNNLLQIVMGGTSLSLDDLESGNLSQVKRNLEQMLEAATRGAQMVRRLQTFASVRTDLTEREGAVFDIATTARNVAEVSMPLWKAEPEKKGIKIGLRLDLEVGCFVRGDENEMFEVLVNLITNAAEAMPEGGDIAVKTHREADEVVIRVRDTGIGIPEEDLSRVFQPFWSTRGVGIGKGMGLAVIHGLVKRHGGTISVQSRVGAGTTFTIRLPLSQEPEKKQEPATKTIDSHLTILVIDDDSNIATLLERICTRVGHRVFKAISGRDGLAIFNKEPVDLVICDLGMPGMSGWDVGKAIRSRCEEKGISKPPFVLLTGWGGQELEREQIVRSGVDAVVGKPLKIQNIHEVIQEVVAKSLSRDADG